MYESDAVLEPELPAERPQTPARRPVDAMSQCPGDDENSDAVGGESTDGRARVSGVRAQTRDFRSNCDAGEPDQRAEMQRPLARRRNQQDQGEREALADDVEP